MQATITVLLTDLIKDLSEPRQGGETAIKFSRAAQVRNKDEDEAIIWLHGYGQPGTALSEAKSGYVTCIGDLRFIKQEDKSTAVQMDIQAILPLEVDESNATLPSQVTVVGTLGSDPDVRYFESGSNLASFSLAVNVTKDVTDWVKVTLWGKPAEVAANFLKKGQQHAVSGKLDFTVGNDGRVWWQVSCGGRGALTLLRNKKAVGADCDPMTLALINHAGSESNSRWVDDGIPF